MRPSPWIGALLAALFITALVLFSTTSADVECEVCMRSGGREACNTSVAAERDLAVSQARSSACAQITGGVTETITCGQQPPLRLQCND